MTTTINWEEQDTALMVEAAELLKQSKRRIEELELALDLVDAKIAALQQELEIARED
jgi:hypothetical protein